MLHVYVIILVWGVFMMLSAPSERLFCGDGRGTPSFVFPSPHCRSIQIQWKFSALCRVYCCSVRKHSSRRMTPSTALRPLMGMLLHNSFIERHPGFSEPLFKKSFFPKSVSRLSKELIRAQLIVKLIFNYESWHSEQKRMTMYTVRHNR